MHLAFLNMSRSIRQKDKFENTSELHQNYCIDGTSARTRPYSLEDIMLRRKNRKEAGEVQAGFGEGAKRELVVEMTAGPLESTEYSNQNSTADVPRHIKLDSLIVRSKKKEDNAFTIGELKSAKGEVKESLDNTETKFKLSRSKDLSHDDVKGNKSDRHANNMRRSGHVYKSKDEPNERDRKDITRKETRGEKTIKESVKERESKKVIDNDDRPVIKRRNVDPARHDYDTESKKQHSRGLIVTDRHGDKNRRAFEKESKRKHQHTDKEENGNRDSVQKLELRTSKYSEHSLKKQKESSGVHHEESRPIRKRSRSKERNNHRGRKSHSFSPRAHKHTFFAEQEYEGLSSHSARDRPQKPHADVERKRISSNGSNSNYRRYSGSSSGLGGYSPRKRKTKAAAKTPSPTNRSPEKKTAAWDLPTTRKDGDDTGHAIPDIHAPSKVVSLNALESCVFPETPVTVKPVSISNNTSSYQIHAVDSIQLTQATRPMRRLYVEHLPASASEKALAEYFNRFLLSLRVNYIQGMLPCISCMINREKGQALLEFLTPEDASAALSFDGKSLLGSIIKVRRPKDFVEVATGIPDKLVDATNSICDIVEESSHKIFVGGISKVISSEMLMEIARAFGPVKAFHFEHNAEIDAPCAFLEYVDHLVTAKAITGLNGLKLGGQVLTVVQAVPDAPELANAGCPPFYEIPEHAKPLLQEPTEILKLKNVLDPGGISSLTEADLEEILEDIRLECARFGIVKTVNIVKPSTDSLIMEVSAQMDGIGSVIENKGSRENTSKESYAKESNDQLKPPNWISEAVEDSGHSNDKPVSNPLNKSREPNDSEMATETGDSDDKSISGITKDENCESVVDDKDASATLAYPEMPSLVSEEHFNIPNISKDLLLGNDKVCDVSLVGVCEIGNKVGVEEGLISGNIGRSSSASGLNSGEEKELDIPKKGGSKEVPAKVDDIFEAGDVLVEFKRAEASCTAAHCLNGRLFDSRTVTVEYVSRTLYRRWFPK